MKILFICWFSYLANSLMPNEYLKYTRKNCKMQEVTFPYLVMCNPENTDSQKKGEWPFQSFKDVAAWKHGRVAAWPQIKLLSTSIVAAWPHPPLSSLFTSRSLYINDFAVMRPPRWHNWSWHEFYMRLCAATLPRGYAATMLKLWNRQFQKRGLSIYKKVLNH